jgi:hypothetical protein
MKHNKLHIAKGFFLLLLTVALLFSSVGVYSVSKTSKPLSAKESKTKKEDKQGKEVFVSPTLEAVVVSILNLDFVKDIVFISFDFSILSQEEVIVPKRITIAEKYFRTLFTHIISPNAP